MAPHTAEVEAVRSALLGWSAGARRALRLREDRTPYRVLVAEVMSAQTRAEAVAPFLERFLARFPSPADLAAASEDDVLQAWRGLGYYRRALQLRRAAAEIVARHRGEVPAEAEALRALPGVGPYVAGAVASLAFGRREAALDANAVRVLARLGDVRLRVDAPAGAAAVRRLAEILLPPAGAGEWNEALMDLGALVCRPRRPRCPHCPLAAHCRARAAGTAAQLPARRPRTAPAAVPVAMLVPRRAGCVAVRRRPAGGLLARMWEFPSAEGEDDPRRLAARFGLCASRVRALPGFRHAFSHRVWNVRAWSAAAEPVGDEAAGLIWVTPERLAELALGGPARRVAAGAGLLPAK